MQLSLPLSCLVFIYLISASPRKLCNAFYLFTKANTHLPRRHGERPLHFASGKVTVREYTRSHFILDRRGKEKERERKGEGEKREKRERTAVLPRHTETLKHNATIPLMEFL